MAAAPKFTKPGLRREASAPPESKSTTSASVLSRDVDARVTLLSSLAIDSNITDLLRAGGLLIVLFQVMYFGEQRFSAPASFDIALRFHLFNIAIGGLL
ncbi:MAG TPA: hypothetical protein VN867_10845, partial [Candidatus Binataceae bacterium]|nr:hypothetical protein [Candidatus Binataceae bacterium]